MSRQEYLNTGSNTKAKNSAAFLSSCFARKQQFATVPSGLWCNYHKGNSVISFCKAWGFILSHREVSEGSQKRFLQKLTTKHDHRWIPSFQMPSWSYLKSNPEEYNSTGKSSVPAVASIKHSFLFISHLLPPRKTKILTVSPLCIPGKLLHSHFNEPVKKKNLKAMNGMLLQCSTYS